MEEDEEDYDDGAKDESNDGFGKGAELELVRNPGHAVVVVVNVGCWIGGRGLGGRGRGLHICLDEPCRPSCFINTIIN